MLDVVGVGRPLSERPLPLLREGAPTPRGSRARRSIPTKDRASSKGRGRGRSVGSSGSPRRAPRPFGWGGICCGSTRSGGAPWRSGPATPRAGRARNCEASIPPFSGKRPARQTSLPTKSRTRSIGVPSSAFWIWATPSEAPRVTPLGIPTQPASSAFHTGASSRPGVNVVAGRGGRSPSSASARRSHNSRGTRFWNARTSPSKGLKMKVVIARYAMTRSKGRAR